MSTKIKQYPVSNKTFNFLRDSGKLGERRVVGGVTFHEVKQVDKNSGVEVVFEIYISPMLDTNFTTIITTPLRKK